MDSPGISQIDVWDARSLLLFGSVVIIFTRSECLCHGRTGEIVTELRQVFGEVAAIPLQVLLTG